MRDELVVVAHHSCEASSSSGIVLHLLDGDVQESLSLLRVWSSAVGANEEAEVFDFTHRDEDLIAANGEAALDEPIEDLANLIEVFVEAAFGRDDDVVDECQSDPRGETTESGVDEAHEGPWAGREAHRHSSVSKLTPGSRESRLGFGCIGELHLH